jgi:hypothetical protein
VIKFFKEFWGLIGGVFMTVLSKFIDSIELVTLQKVFYISSIILIWIGTYQALTHRKKKKEVINKILQIEKTNNTVNLVKDPQKKGESILKIIDIVIIGGKTMKDYLKTLSKKQWFSLAATLLLVILGIASAFIPELEVIGENLEYYFVIILGVSTPGIFSRGKEEGEKLKRKTEAKSKIRENNAKIKQAKKELDLIEKDNAYLLPILARQKEYGGKLTPDQELAKSNYETQKASVNERIKALEDDNLKLMEVLK